MFLAKVKRKSRVRKRPKETALTVKVLKDWIVLEDFALCSGEGISRLAVGGSCSCQLSGASAKMGMRPLADAYAAVGGIVEFKKEYKKAAL